MNSSMEGMLSTEIGISIHSTAASWLERIEDKRTILARNCREIIMDERCPWGEGGCIYSMSGSNNYAVAIK